MTPKPYTHLLVPTDFRPESQAAYRVAFTTARGCGARVTLLHVAPTPIIGLSDDEYQGLDAIRLMHRSAERWHLYEKTASAVTAENAELLTRLKAELPNTDGRPKDLRFEIRRGDVVEEIARYVRDFSADLIITTASPSGFRSLFSTRLVPRLARKLPKTEILRVTAARAPTEAATRG